MGIYICLLKTDDAPAFRHFHVHRICRLGDNRGVSWSAATMTELAWREEAICGRCNSAVTYVSMYIYIYENVIAARTISTGAHAGRVNFRTTYRADESDKPGLRRRGAASRVSRRIVMQGHGAGRALVMRRRRLVSQELGARNALGDGPSPDSLSKRLRRSTPTSLRQRALRRHM